MIKTTGRGHFKQLSRLFSAAILSFIAGPAVAADTKGGDCADLPAHAVLKSALTSARAESNGGLNTDMWGVVVNRDGVVCSVAFTGKERGEQWPGSRVIAAEKANTANAFSLPKLAVSTANLYSATQPAGSLYGLLHTNPTDPAVAYAGSAASYGQPDDPMVGKKIGGIVVFGGGVALYDKNRKIVGGLGVSGDTSCADHHIAWRTRHNLSLDYVPGGVSLQKDKPDNIVYDITNGVSVGGWGHPACSGDVAKIADGLAPVAK